MREDGAHLLINLRSHLNTHFDSATPSVLVLPQRRVRSLRVVSERGVRTHVGDNGVIFESAIRGEFLDVAFDGDTVAVAAALAAEGARRGKGGSRFNRSALRMLPDGTLRIASRDETNRLRPGLDVLGRQLGFRYRRRIRRAGAAAGAGPGGPGVAPARTGRARPAHGGGGAGQGAVRHGHDRGGAVHRRFATLRAARTNRRDARSDVSIPLGPLPRVRWSIVPGRWRTPHDVLALMTPDYDMARNGQVKDRATILAIPRSPGYRLSWGAGTEVTCRWPVRVGCVFTREHTMAGGMNLIVNLDVDDLERAIGFYGSVFGLDAGRRFGAVGAELLGSAVPIHLLVKASGTPAAPAIAQCRSYERHWTPVHLDFVVDDIDAAVRKAVAAGAQLEEPVGTHPWGKLALMADPFGHGFCLVQLLGRGYDEITE